MERPNPNRSIASLIAFLLGLALGCGGQTEPRNVVVISIDSLGAKHVSSYGYARDTTPTLDALAAEGALFEWTYTPQPWTLTAHLSMMTGVYPQVHAASEKRPATTHVRTLAELLSERGFETGAFVGGDYYSRPKFGLGRGFDTYAQGKPGYAQGKLKKENAKRIRWIDRQAELRAADPAHRFFLFVHFFDVHSQLSGDLPYAAPSAYIERYLPDGPGHLRGGSTDLLIGMQIGDGATPEDREILTGLYDASVRFTDVEGLAPILERLRENGFWDDTLIVVTSDHGEEIFEHGLPTHQQPYEETARVPLVIRGPGVPAGLRIDSLVGLVDIVPTVLSLLDIPVPRYVQGVSLTPFFHGETEPLRSAAFVDGILGGLPHVMRATASSVTMDVEDGRWSFVATVETRARAEGYGFELSGDGELYRLDDDPGQLVDLAASRPELARRLGDRLLDWYAANDVMARWLASGTEPEELLDEADIERLQALGYLR